MSGQLPRAREGAWEPGVAYGGVSAPHPDFWAWPDAGLICMRTRGAVWSVESSSPSSGSVRPAVREALLRLHQGSPSRRRAAGLGEGSADAKLVEAEGLHHHRVQTKCITHQTKCITHLCTRYYPVLPE